MGLFDEVQDAVRFVRAAAPETPRVGVVLGSGLGAFAQQLSERVVIPYHQIPHFPTSGVQGHAGELVLGVLGGCASPS